MSVILLDLNNFAYRCRLGVARPGGKSTNISTEENTRNPTTSFLYMFVRNLRALVATFQESSEKPCSLVFVKEGSPDHRHEIFPEYKAQRRVKVDDPKANEKWKEIMALKEQMDDAVGFCLKNLEVSVIKHPRLEADDLIANVARDLAKDGKNCIIASNDKDFEQLLGDGYPQIQVYDTDAKEFRSIPKSPLNVEEALTTKQLISIKALMGDKSDNIPGVTGFGPKKALKAVMDPEFDPVIALSADNLAIYERNLKLVRFYELNQDEWRKVQLDRGRFDPAAIMVDFVMNDFKSLLEQKAYDRFIDTFGALERAKL